MLPARPIAIAPALTAAFRDHLDARRRADLRRELESLRRSFARPIESVTTAPYRRLQRARLALRILDLERLLNEGG